GRGDTKTLRQLVRAHQATQREKTNTSADRDERPYRELRSILGHKPNQKKKHPDAPAPNSPDEHALQAEYAQLDRDRAYKVSGGGMDNPSSKNDTSTELNDSRFDQTAVRKGDEKFDNSGASLAENAAAADRQDASKNMVKP